MYAFQDQSEGEFNGGYAITPNYSVFSVASSTVTDDIDYIIEDNKKYADDGTLPRFKLDNKYYTWNYNENRYESKENSDTIIFKINPIDKSKLDDTKDIYLFFNKNNPCGKTTYKYVGVKEYLKANSDLSSFIHENNDNRKDLPCIGATSSTVDNGNNNWKFDPNNQSDDGSNEECNTTSFEYLSIPSDKDIQSIKTVFLKGFNDRKSIQTKEREQGKYSHIQYVNNSGKEGSITDIDKDDLELLEDKLHLLSYYKKDTYVGVVFLKRNFKEFYKADLVDKLASEVIKSSAGELGGKKAMLIIVPYTYKVAHDTDCLPIGFSQTKDNDIVKYSAVKIDTKKKWLSKVLGIYTEIPKPLFVNRYYKMADGKIIQRAESSVKDIKGYPFINNLTFYESKGYDAIRSLNDEYKNTNFKEYLGLYAQYLEKANKLYFEYTTKEEQEGSINNANLWKTISTDDLGKFREIYIDDVKLTNKLWEKSKESWAWGSKVEISLNTSPILSKHFYNFDKMALVDDVVYGVVDGVGLIPGVDTFTDPFGAVYAGIRGDYTNATIYSASFAIPLAGSAYMKGALKVGEDASQLVGIVARKADNANGYILEAKKISEIGANEVHVSSVYYGGDQKLTQKVLDGVKADSKYIDGDYVRNALKYSDEISPLLKDSKELILKTFGRETKFATDDNTVRKVAEFLTEKNKKALSYIGGEQGLQDIIKANVRAGCTTCGTATTNFLKNMDEYLDDVLDFSNKYSKKDGFDDVLKELKKVNSGGSPNYAMEGARLC
ncbi:hypothetical protein [Chishuiella sp.]|uniref:hypothetical protein n=1 Tax=Chishuiella sp. TaxID=1969467 RepID=UPI0028B07F85|nr:hypothetical protein [Chishuiella sp.]